MKSTRDTRQLNWLLAWAIVFCDIGTSVYYVPGILYGSVHNKTPFFVLASHACARSSTGSIFASLTASVEKPVILASREVGNVNKGGL
jgi:hypothetical protein